MTEAQAIEAAKETFAAAWAAAHPTVPFFFDNEAGASGTSFVRVTFLPTVSQQMTLGPPGQRRWERRGYIVVQLFAPMDQGSAVLDGYVGDVRAILEGVTIAPDVVIDEGSTVRQPDDTAWAQMNVRLAYRIYETR